MLSKIMYLISDPVFSIVASQLVILWSIIVSHWSTHKYVKYATFSVFLLVLLINTYSLLERSREDKRSQDEIFSSLAGKTSETIARLNDVNKQIDSLNYYVSNDIKNSYIELDQTLKNYNAEASKSLQTLAEANKQTAKSITEANSRLAKMNSIIDNYNMKFLASLTALSTKVQSSISEGINGIDKTLEIIGKTLSINLEEHKRMTAQARNEAAALEQQTQQLNRQIQELQDNQNHSNNNYQSTVPVPTVITPLIPNITTRPTAPGVHIF